MTYGAQIAVDDAEVRESLAILHDGLSRHAYRPTIGASVVRLIQRHLVDWNETHPNRMGGKRTNIIAAAAQATRWDEQPNGVEITITNPALGARWRGAEIRPVNAKFLAIPARPEAYGKSPREFDLQAIFPKRGEARGPAIGWLVQVQDTERALKGGKRKGQLQRARKGETATHGEGGVMFWLVKRVTLQPEPEIMPTSADIVSAAANAVRERFLRAKRRRQVQ